MHHMIRRIKERDKERREIVKPKQAFINNTIPKIEFSSDVIVKKFRSI